MKKYNRYSKKPLAAAVAVASAIGSQALPAHAEIVLEEVIVTAQVRSQSIQDIPYNITAIQGKDLVDRHIINQTDMLRSFAGVTTVDRGYRNAGTVNSIIIRGLNVDNGLNGDIGLNAVPTVSTYVNNTPLFANFLLKDLDRVEVLRGPQGTLYGSGALGGTVRYITNKPNLEKMEGQIDATYSETEDSDGNNWNLDAMFNLPLGDKVALRASIGKLEEDGIIDYVNQYQLDKRGAPLVATPDGCVSPQDATNDQIINNGGCYTSKEDSDDVEITYGKAALLFEPNERLSLLASYQRQKDDTGGRRAFTIGDNNQPADSPLYFDYDDRESGQVLAEPSERKVQLSSLDVEFELGFATLTSNTSYYEHDGSADSDNGGLWVSGGQSDPELSRDWIYNFGYTGWPRPAQRAERYYDDEAWVQELRLISKPSDSKLDWIGGVYYMDQDRTVGQDSWNPGMNEYSLACAEVEDACPGFWPATFYPGQPLSERDLEYRRDEDFTDLAVYGELTWNFSPTVRATLGARWFDMEVKNNTIFGYPLVEGWTSERLPEDKFEDDDVLFKGNVSWDMSDTMMLYGTVSEGYRRGGANAIPSVESGNPFGEFNSEAIQYYDKDTVINYEIGIKGETSRMTYTASLFYVDWDDPQLNTRSKWYSFYMAANGDSAYTQGIELEADGYITEALHFNVSYTYTEAEIDADFIHPQDGSVIAEDGADLPLTPENVFSAALDYTWGVGEDADIIARLSGYYQDESENYIDTDSTLSQTFDDFWLVDASITYVTQSWKLGLFAKNIGDEDGITGAFPQDYWSYDTGVFENWYGNGNRQMISQPRTLGASLSYTF